MTHQAIIVALSCLAAIKFSSNMIATTHYIDPEANLNILERIKLHGYPVEVHKIFTEDDYILAAYRIPYGLKGPSNTTRTPIILIHGMGGSPEVFLFLRSKLSSPYYLADRGFDVWLLASRGSVTIFGDETHRNYNWNEDDEYWYYSLHEIGVYDLAANIDYILKLTGQPKVSIIGHSAGGNEAYCLLAERPQYNQKVKVIINWGSSPILKRCDYPLAYLLSTIRDFLKVLLKRLDMAEVAPILYRQFRPFIRAVCADEEFSKFCLILAGAIGSHRSYLVDIKDIQLIISALPPRLSTQQVVHFLDNYSIGEFRKFDYGPKKNMKLYGHTQPPKYNLSAVLVPGVFFLADGDSYIQQQDIFEAMEEIPNVVMIHKVTYSKFTHLDHILAKNATHLLYEPTFKILRDIDRGVVPPPIKVPRKN